MFAFYKDEMYRDTPNSNSRPQGFVLFCFFPFNTLNMPVYSFLACRVSADNSTDSLMGHSFVGYNVWCFVLFFLSSLAAFRILLIFDFDNFIVLCLRYIV